MRWPWQARTHPEASSVTEARLLDEEADKRLAASRRARPYHERQGQRVQDQMVRNHFGELLRLSMEGR